MNAVALLLLIQPVLLGQMDAEQSMAAGRDALDNWWPRDYPWYDAQTDGVRRVEIRRPRDWSWLRNWANGLGAWLRSLWPDWDLSWLWGWLPNWNWRRLLRMPTTVWGWTARIALVLLLALVVYVLVRAGRRLHTRRAKSGTGGATSGQEGAGRLEALPFPAAQGQLDLLGEARTLYQQGNYGQAVLYLFSFQLAQLDKQQIIRLTKGKTNRQYLREIGPRRLLRRLVGQTMVAFEDVFFGNHTLDRARFESCWSRLDEFQSLAAGGSG